MRLESKRIRDRAIKESERVSHGLAPRSLFRNYDYSLHITRVPEESVGCKQIKGLYWAIQNKKEPAWRD